MYTRINGDGKEDEVRLFLVLSGYRTKDKKLKYSRHFLNIRKDSTLMEKWHLSPTASLVYIFLEMVTLLLTGQSVLTTYLFLWESHPYIYTNLFLMGLEGASSLPITCHLRNGWDHRKKKILEIHKNGWLLIRRIFLPM